VPTVEVPGMPESETSSSTSVDTDVPGQSESSDIPESESEEPESETEAQVYEVNVLNDEKDNAVVVFAADLLKLKDGKLKDLDEEDNVGSSVEESEESLPKETNKVSEAEKEAALKEIDLMKEVLPDDVARSEEHTSELQSRFDLVCRLLLEKKKHK